MTPIETLYAGELGDAFLRRCAGVAPKRLPFWRRIADRTRPERVLEVGSGGGENLACLAESVPFRVGVDVNANALHDTKRVALPVMASALSLPYSDGAFDLVISCGLLIHVADGDVPAVMGELARVSSDYVLLCEYEDARRREIPWRGQRNVLFADAFSYRFWQQQPRWRPRDRGYLTSTEGFDRMTWSVFASPQEAAP